MVDFKKILLPATSLSPLGAGKKMIDEQEQIPLL